MNISIEHNRRNFRLLGYSYRNTLISTILTAIAPLVCTLVDGLCSSNFLGEDAFNAVNTVMPLANAVSVLTLICNMGGSVLAARELASGNREKANRIFTMSMLSAIAVALVAIIAIAANLSKVSFFLCPHAAGAEQARIYLEVLLGYFLIVPICTTLSNFLSVEGHPALVTTAVIVANVLNASLDIVFILLLDWGIAGAAWATVISGVVNVLFYVPHFLKGKSEYKFVKQESWLEGRRILFQNLRHGIGFNIFYIVINLFVFYCNSLISKVLGVQALSTFGLCIQLQSFTFGIVVGICIGGIGHISRLQGESDKDGIRYIHRSSITIALIFYGALALIMALFPELILKCFNMKTPEALQASRMPLACFGIFYLCFTFLAVFTTLVMQMEGHVEGKVIFIFGIGILTALNMLLWSYFSPERIWFGFVTGSIPVVIFALVFAHSFHRKNHNYTPFTMMDVIPVNIRFDYTMDYKLSRMDTMIHELKTFTEVCELPEQIIDRIIFCCTELCEAVGEQRIRNNINAFDLSFIETGNTFRFILKDCGTPSNPLECDVAGYERMMESGIIPSERDTRLYTINKMSNHIEYSFVFGMNITVLEWNKV